MLLYTYMPIDNIAGVSFGTITIALRFFGALWASVGLAYFTWGMTDYFLHHGGEEKITKGCMLLLGFTLVWGAIKLFVYFVF